MEKEEIVVENDLDVIRYNTKEQYGVPAVEVTMIKDMCGGKA